MANLIEVIFKGVNQVDQSVNEVKDSLAGIEGAAAQAGDSLGGIFGIQAAQAMMDFKFAAQDAFAAASEAAMQFVDAAAESELVGVRMEATIRALGDQAPTTAGQINDLADELSKLTGFDDEALVEAQTTLARIGSVSEENFERATRAAVDLAAATGMDLKSTFQQVAIAIEKGDFGRLARQIGALPPEMRDAAKAAMEMGDTLKAQDIILTGIESKVGGVGEEIGNTFVGQMNKLEVAYGNFQESVGTPLIKLFTDLPAPIQNTGFFMYSLGQTFGPVVSATADLAIATRGLNAALGGQGLIGMLKQVQILGATSFGPMLISLGAVALAVGAVIVVWDQWNKQIVKTNEEGAKAVAGTWDKFFADLEASGADANEIMAEYQAAQERANQALEDANPIVRTFIFNKDEMISGDDELRESLLRVTGSQEEVNRLLAESGQTATQASQEVQTAGANMAGFWESIPETIRFTIDQAGNSASMLGTILGAAIQLADVEAQAGMTSIMNSVTGGVATILLEASQSSQMLVQIVQAIWQNIVQYFQDGINRVITSVQSFWSNLQSSFNNIISAAQSWGTNIVQGIWTGIQNGWTWLLNMIRTNINNLLQWVRDLLQIGSPSELYAEQIGVPLAQGIGIGFSRGLKNAIPEMNRAMSGLIPSMSTASINTAVMQPVYTSAPVGYAPRGGATTINVTGGFYSPLTRSERRVIRKEQEEMAQREILRSLR